MKPTYLLILFFFLSILGCRKIYDPLPQNYDLNQQPVNPKPPEEEPQKRLNLASILQSNMVLQRDKPINIWGTVNLVEKITVTTSWDSTSYETKAGSDNNWQITLPPVPVNRTPQTIIVAAEGAQSIVLDNILIGDVWLCAGQSNMVMPLGNIPPFAGVDNYVQEIGAADHPLIRFTKIPEASKGKLMNELASQPDWKVCSPQTASELSAVAYYFAQKLQRELNIPVGIVVAAVNGSWCESWTDLSSLQAEPA